MRIIRLCEGRENISPRPKLAQLGTPSYITLTSYAKHAMPVLTKMIGFVATTNAENAKKFYGGILGFRLMSEDQYALAYDANGTMLRVTKAQQFTPARGTVVGWDVDDIHAAVRELTARGVMFEQFNLPFMKQDELGVWSAPNGDQVAWFKDPDGNTLSVSHHNPANLAR